MADVTIYDATSTLDSFGGWYGVGARLSDGCYGECKYEDKRPQDRSWAVDTATERAHDMHRRHG